MRNPRGVLIDVVPAMAAVFIYALLMMPPLPTTLCVGGLVRGLLAGWRCTAASGVAVADEPMWERWGGVGSPIVCGLVEV